MSEAVLQRATTRWVAGLFALSVLLQRFAVPGQPVALLLPVLLAGSAWGLLRGLATFDRYRLVAWLLASGAMAAAIGAQELLIKDARISILSWGLFVTSWAPFTLRLVDRRRATYVATLRAVVVITRYLALVCIAMMVSQLAGLHYQDWMAQVVPDRFLLKGFVITYPIQYGSAIYRANAWIGLEPSIVSAQLGVGLIAALLVRAKPATIVILVGGLVCATSGSGFAIAIVAIAVILALPGRHVLRPYAVPAGAAMLVAAVLPIGQDMLGRVTEVFHTGSSANLRAVLPYQYLWNLWSDNTLFVLLGGGPGSSQKIVVDSGIDGLLVPTPIKIFFDYGLVAGGLLAAFIVVCYLGGPSRALAVSLFVSLWTLQPGTTVVVLITPLLLLVTWWSPRGVPVIEREGAMPAEPPVTAESAPRRRRVPV